MSAETKTGVFFIIGLVILGAFTFKLEDVSKMMGRRYMINTSFSHTSGLTVGDPVAIVGVQVGVVTALEVSDHRVRVEMEIRDGHRIYPNALATVEWAGLLGRKYVDISIGDTDGEPLSDGARITGVDSASVGDIMTRVQGMAETMSALLNSENVGLVKSIGGKLDRALDGLVTVAGNLEEGKGTVAKLFASDEIYVKLNGIADELQSGAKQFNELTAKIGPKIDPILDDVGKATPELKSAITAVKNLAERFEKGQGTIPKLMDDPEVYNNLAKAVANLRSFTDKLEKGDKGVLALLQDEKFAEDLRGAAAELRQVAQLLSAGEGTVPKLLRDDEIYRDVKKLLADAREAIRGVQEQVPVGTFAGVLFSAF